MTDLGKYLYCIIRCSEARTFDDVAPIGDASGPVHTVPCDGLAVVVSDTPVKDHETTRANVLAHERVQERVMEDFTLLPVRFGSVTNDFASAVPDIRKLLESRSQDFDRLLADVEGKVELGLKALWRDEKAIFEEIVAENQGIRRLRDSLRRKPPAVARFEGIPLGERVKEALERKKTVEASAIRARLSGVASRVRENDIIVDRMILNEAFLVDKGRQEEFDMAVSKLDEELNHRIVFKYTGPNPPWNFVEIIVNWEEL
jgi:hypothetical protein